jgi:hypothetical protein
VGKSDSHNANHRYGNLMVNSALNIYRCHHMGGIKNDRQTFVILSNSNLEQLSSALISKPRLHSKRKTAMLDFKREHDIESNSLPKTEGDVFGDEEGHQVCFPYSAIFWFCPGCRNMTTSVRFTTRHCHGK